MSEITLSLSEVPSNFCYTNPQDDYPKLAGLLSASFSSALSTFNYGSDVPAPEDRNKPWLRTNADGTPDRRYEYFNGNWISLNPMPVGAVIMYEGSEASIVTFDGGEAGAITSVSGAMWEKVTEFNGRFPIGPGTTPFGTVVAIGGQGGTDSYSLAIARSNLPNEPLQFGIEGSTNVTETNDDRKPLGFIRASGGADISYQQDTTLKEKVARTSDLGDGDALEFNQLPPYNAIWFIRRTARLYYRI